MVGQLFVFLAVALLGTGWVVSAPSAPLIPYEVDSETLHLWHLDEDGPPFRDEGPSSTPLLGLFNGAETGQSALLGLGHSVSFHHNTGGTPGMSDQKGAILTAASSLSNGPDDRAPESLLYQGQDGAFTYEALIKLDLLPAEAKVIALAIISMDGEDLEGERIFNLRIEREGFLAFAPLIHSDAKGRAIATLPRNGPHALNTTDWFHVAVTYNGKEDTPDNLRLYWTRIGTELSTANLIGTGELLHDLKRDRRGDFAIGNEARTSVPTNAEGEPFPGCIDEVRISSVARHPSDFLFVPPHLRLSPAEVKANEVSFRQTSPLKLGIVDVMVDGERISLPSLSGKPLVLPPGLHRFDFDLSFSPEQMAPSVKLRTQLEGMDNTWRKTPLGMSLQFDVLDAKERVVSQARAVAIGSSYGWENRDEISGFSSRSEPLFFPPEATSLRVTLDSGSPDTTGSFAIDDLVIILPGEKNTSIWPNGNFAEGDNLTSAAGVPKGWIRGGSDPAIAQVDSPGKPESLAVIDGDEKHSGSWSAVIPLDPTLHGGKTVAVRWKEIYNVIPGSLYRTSYVNVPAGSYTFRAVWLNDRGVVDSGGVELPIEIRLPIWERAWFWPLVVFGVIGLMALIIIREARRINRRKLRQLWIQNTLERDRARIARDMHDDLGTRVSVLNINASLVKRELGRDPEKAWRHLDKLNSSTRELVGAMKELVWAVDPSHDSLEHLATHLTQLTEDMFGDGPVRCRLDIPANFPDQMLSSGFRHDISLAVKEALNNVLKHAGPCEVYLSMACENSHLEIEIRDDGCGFSLDQLTNSSHGLRNYSERLEGLGGNCQIDSSPEEGTRIRFSCSILQKPTLVIP